MGGYYANGRTPLSMLVKIGPDHYVTPATKVRWEAMRADVYANEGVWLEITPGPNAYRWYEAQVQAKQAACARGRCQDAATAGASSHGLLFQGRPALALDISNWGLLGATKFYYYARKWGFEPGYFDWEPWHIIDWSPWTMPALAGSVTSPQVIDHALLRRQKEDTMYVKGTSYASVYAVFTDANGRPALRACGAAEQSYAATAGIVTTGYDSTLTALANECGYGRPIIPEVAHAGLEVVMIQAPDITTTYALWGPGYWDETTDPEVANGWARVYGNAENLTYAQWEDRKRIGTGGN